jgi:hypothetical protein
MLRRPSSEPRCASALVTVSWSSPSMRTSGRPHPRSPITQPERGEARRVSFARGSPRRVRFLCPRNYPRTNRPNARCRSCPRASVISNPKPATRRQQARSLPQATASNEPPSRQPTLRTTPRTPSTPGPIPREGAIRAGDAELRPERFRVEELRQALAHARAIPRR